MPYLFYKKTVGIKDQFFLNRDPEDGLQYLRPTDLYSNKRSTKNMGNRTFYVHWIALVWLWPLCVLELYILILNFILELKVLSRITRNKNLWNPNCSEDRTHNVQYAWADLYSDKPVSQNSSEPYISCSEAHSRHSARLFLQSSELELAHPPHPQASVFPLLWFGGDGGVTHSLAGEGVGGSQLRTRGQSLW